MTEDLPCDISGECTPMDNDEQSYSNCIYCGKELIKVGFYWKTWDWDLKFDKS